MRELMAPDRGRLGAILHQRCPRCRSGKIFSGPIRMRKACAVCDYRFEREPGFFVGAMYVSYALAVPLIALLCFLVYRLRPGWPLAASLGAAALLSAPFIPVLFRYSRVIWMHLDAAIDPKS